MQHECRITVLETRCYPELQEKYLADSKSGPCPFFKPGDTFLLKRTPQQDDFYQTSRIQPKMLIQAELQNQDLRKQINLEFTPPSGKKEAV